MSEQEQIEAAIKEARSYSGSSVAFLTIELIVTGHTSTFAKIRPLLDRIVTKAMFLSTRPSTWDSDASDEVSQHILSVIARMKQAYGDGFHVDGAQDYLRKVASGAELLRKELEG